MDFTRRIELDAPYDDAIGRVKDALKDQGFGVLTEIDVRQTLKDKLDLDVEPFCVFGPLFRLPFVGPRFRRARPRPVWLPRNSRNAIGVPPF